MKVPNTPAKGLPASYLRCLADQRWRLDNLYWIKDKDGRQIPFRMNAEQRAFYENTHGRNLILKARQLGFTTLVCILLLDIAMFEHRSCALIAHKLTDAQRFFREKVNFAYSKLHPAIRAANPARNDREGELVFALGGSVAVNTSFRGGTLQYLHVSEFGKICARNPDAATEIMTGALEAVSKHGTATFESTAEGQDGDFYRLCTEAMADQAAGRRLGRLDWKPFFFPWHGAAEYALEEDEAGVPITDELRDYFARLHAEHGITLTQEQQQWYAAKARTLKDKVRQEYPSYPEEAFEQPVEGAYYARQLRELRAEGRLVSHADFPHNPDVPVHTAWDIGVGDSTSIWFFQRVGERIHVIDYYANSGEGLRHYMTVLLRYQRERGYQYGEHWAPHDIDNREWGSDAKTRRDLAWLGYDIDGEHFSIRFEVVPRISVDEGIEHVREVLPRCVFDADRCGSQPAAEQEAETPGFIALTLYRKEWDTKRGIWKNNPLHDHTSHAADAFRYLAVVCAKRVRKARRRRLRGLS